MQSVRQSERQSHQQSEDQNQQVAIEGEQPGEDSQSLNDDYYLNSEEQSVIYKNEKVFDEPKRAKYGIKKSANHFDLDQ